MFVRREFDITMCLGHFSVATTQNKSVFQMYEGMHVYFKYSLSIIFLPINFIFMLCLHWVGNTLSQHTQMLICNRIHTFVTVICVQTFSQIHPTKTDPDL